MFQLTHQADNSGMTVKDTVFRVLKEVMVTDLAVKYNFNDKKGRSQSQIAE